MEKQNTKKCFHDKISRTNSTESGAKNNISYFHNQKIFFGRPFEIVNIGGFLYLIFVLLLILD